jgi:hypothetical protein
MLLVLYVLVTIVTIIAKIVLLGVEEEEKVLDKARADRIWEIVLSHDRNYDKIFNNPIENAAWDAIFEKLDRAKSFYNTMWFISFLSTAALIFYLVRNVNGKYKLL